MRWYDEIKKLRTLDWRTKGLLRIKLDEAIKELSDIRNYMISNGDMHLEIPTRHFMVDYNDLDYEFGIGMRDKKIKASDEVKIKHRIVFINHYCTTILKSNCKNRKESQKVRAIRIRMNQLYKEAIGE